MIEAEKLDVSVVIPIRNESINLAACLASVGCSFKDVYVVDSQSTDDSRDVALSFGAKVVSFDWNGEYPKKRNWFLQNHTLSTPWVLFLDADETLNNSFVSELREVLRNTKHVGFWLNYENWFMGYRLRYGDPMRKIALFRVDSGEYERIEGLPKSNFDMEIHEHPILNGSIGEIRSKIGHRDYRGLEHYIAKHNVYSTWEAHRTIALEKDPTSFNRLNDRQKFKYKNIRKWWFSRFYFAVCYFVKLGILDGRAGFVFSMMKLRYFQDIRLKIHEETGRSLNQKSTASH